MCHSAVLLSPPGGPWYAKRRRTISDGPMMVDQPGETAGRDKWNGEWDARQTSAWITRA